MEQLELSNSEEARYLRQIHLAEIGTSGQRKLKEASVLIIGLGGLGSSAAFYLAAAGIGRIGLLDCDTVQPSNLNRQILHSTTSIGQPKTQSSYETLTDFNPHLTLERFSEPFSGENGREIAEIFDLIIDATDSFDSKYLINDICVELGKPDIYGAATGLEGRIAVFAYQQGPCLRCLFPEPPQKQSHETPILGAVTGVIGSLQANEAIKIILGLGDILSNRLVIFDAKKTKFSEFFIVKNPECKICH